MSLVFVEKWYIEKMCFMCTVCLNIKKNKKITIYLYLNIEYKNVVDIFNVQITFYLLIKQKKI